MSYNYADGDGLDVLDPTEPNGAAEPIANLDDSIRQIKAFLRDEVAGGASWRARLGVVEAGIGVNNGFFHAVTTAHLDVVAGAGAAKIPFTSELKDGLAQFSAVNARFSPLATGSYLFKLNARFQIAASTPSTNIQHTVELIKNGTDVVARAVVDTGALENGGQIHIDRVVDLAVGDTVEAFYNITIGSGTITGRILFDITQTYLQGWRVA